MQQDIVPFVVPSLSDKQRTQLQEKLADTIYPNELETNVGWEYGTSKHGYTYLNHFTICSFADRCTHVGSEAYGGNVATQL